VWDARAPTAPLLTERLHSDPLLCLALSGCGRRGASGAADAQIHSFRLDIPAGRLRRAASFAAHAAAAPSASRGTGELAFRAGDGLLAAATWDGRVRLFDVRGGAALASMRYHCAQATCVAWANDALGGLASGGRDGAIALWNVYPPRVEQGLKAQHTA